MTSNKFVCHRCGDCCKYLEFYTKLIPTEIEFYKTRGIEMFHVKDDDYVLRIPHRCDQLLFTVNEHEQWYATCKIHDNKPAVCRDWPTEVEGWPSPCKHMSGNDGI